MNPRDGATGTGRSRRREVAGACPGRARHRGVAVGSVVGALVAPLVTVLALDTAGHRSTAPQSRPPAAAGAPPSPSELSLATVSIAAGGKAVSVPRSFLGISTEYWTIPVWASHLSLLGQVLSSLTQNGPMVLRIGGSSADQTRWAPTKELPEWVFELTPSWLRQLRQIINRFGVRVILDLNLVTATPRIAVRWARAAEAALPTESILGFEIGNEPDIYSPAAWRKTTGVGTGAPALPQTITAAGYARSFRAYAEALTKVDRGVPLYAPALSDPAANLNWISQLLAHPHPLLRAITVHRYPLSACSRPGSETFPTIARVLGENATLGMARTITGAVLTAKHAGLPVRLTEINSVTCGGRKGVSNTFATALWAPDALFELLEAGASSAAIHVRANAINMAFSLTNHRLTANPLLYGLVLFARTLGPSPQLVPLKLTAPPSLGLKAWAVRVRGDSLHILLINKSTHTARVTLQISATGPVTTQSLLARSARATSGVTLGGQHLDPQGQWQGAPTIKTLSAGAGGYQVIVRGISATLLTAPQPRASNWPPSSRAFSRPATSARNATFSSAVRPCAPSVSRHCDGTYEAAHAPTKAGTRTAARTFV